MLDFVFVNIPVEGVLDVFSFGGDGDDVNGGDVIHESLHMDSMNQHKLTKYYGGRGV